MSTTAERLAQNRAETAQSTPVSKSVRGYLDAVKSFETDRIDLIQKHAKLAWRLVAVFAGLAILC